MLAAGVALFVFLKDRLSLRNLEALMSPAAQSVLFQSLFWM